MKKLVIILATISVTTSASATNLIDSLLSRLSNNTTVNDNNIRKVKVGKYYYYKLNDSGSITTNNTSAIVSKVKSVKQQILTPDDSVEYDPVAIKEALEWQAGENKATATDVVDRHEKELLYGEDSPLRDDAVAEAWKRARKAEDKLKKHREYMNNVMTTKNDISDIKENDPKDVAAAAAGR